MNTGFDIFKSPIGPIHVVVGEKGVKAVVLTEEHWTEYRKKQGEIPQDKKLCSAAISQLEEYFAGSRREFTVPLAIEGTDFCKKVWNALLSIPYGETRTYSDISKAVGSPKAHRAVGQANRANPLPIFIPCHRVLGKDSALTGYMGKNGIKIKECLLKLENYL